MCGAATFFYHYRRSCNMSVFCILYEENSMMVVSIVCFTTALLYRVFCNITRGEKTRAGQQGSIASAFKEICLEYVLCVSPRNRGERLCSRYVKFHTRVACVYCSAHLGIEHATSSCLDTDLVCVFPYIQLATSVLAPTVLSETVPGSSGENVGSGVFSSPACTAPGVC